MLRRLTRHPAVQAAAARWLGAYLLFVYRTTRWQVLGLENVQTARAVHGNVVAAFWHENLPLMPELLRQAGEGAAAHVLVSRHRDGRFIGGVVKRFGIAMVHASSSRGGAAGLLALLRLTRTGALVVITPDGPRGPRRTAAPGVAQIAGSTGLPVLPCAGRVSRGIALGSWDRMVVPLPFGRGVLAMGPAVPVGRLEGREALPRIAAALDAACDAADAALGLARR
jgi:lysophospholipid acyltransferase (LPLAT)-like uncharacterized protein